MPSSAARPPMRTSTPTVASKAMSRPMKNAWWGATKECQVSRTNGTCAESANDA